MKAFDETEADLDVIRRRQTMLRCDRDHICYKNHGLVFEGNDLGPGLGKVNCWCYKAGADGYSLPCPGKATDFSAGSTS